MLDIFFGISTTPPSKIKWSTPYVGMLRSFGRGFSLRVPGDKIALPEGGTVLFETRSIDAVRGTTKWKLWRGKFITITLKLNLPH